MATQDWGTRRDGSIPTLEVKDFTSRWGQKPTSSQTATWLPFIWWRRGKKAHKGNFQQQQDTCANMSSFSLQCGGSASLSPDLSGSLGTNASLQCWNLRLHGWSKGDEYVLVSKKKETKGKHEPDGPTESFGMFPFAPQTVLTVVWILQTKNKKSGLSWSPSLTDVKMNNRWMN